MATKTDNPELNNKQIKMAQMLADPTFTGSITELCEKINVARTTFYKWMDKSEFREYVDSLIDKFTDSELSRVWKALIRKCDCGDTQAIKLYFELKGKYQLNVKESAEVTIVDDIPSQ